MGIYPNESLVNIKKKKSNALFVIRGIEQREEIFLKTSLFFYFPNIPTSKILVSYNFPLPWDLPPPSTLALTCFYVGPSSPLQGADSRDFQMNQALRLLENEHQELQAKIECLQSDRDLCSSDSRLLQGTLLLGASG